MFENLCIYRGNFNIPIDEYILNYYNIHDTIKMEIGENYTNIY